MKPKWCNKITLFGGVVNINQTHNLDGNPKSCITIIIKRGPQSHYVRVFTPRDDLVPGMWVSCAGEPVLLRGRFSVDAHSLEVRRQVGTKGQMKLALKGGE